MRATGTPSWMVWITVCTALSTVGKAHTAAEMASGIGYSLTRHFGDDAERAFRADEQSRQVVARRRFSGAAAGPDDCGRRRAPR